MLQDQEFELDIGQGLDKKTDPKAVVQSKLLLLENGVFTEGHQVAKRDGYDALTNATYSPYTNTAGTLLSPKLVKEFKDELICADSNRLYSYSPTLNSWVDKGPYESLESTQIGLSAGTATSSQDYESLAILGNYVLVAWQETNASTNTIGYAIIDSVTGAKILPDTYGTNSSTPAVRPKAFTLGNSVLAASFILSGSLFIVYFTISGGTITTSTSAAVFTGIGNTDVYDIVGTATGGVVTWNGNTKTVDTTGTVTHSATGFTGVLVPSITVGSDNNIWVYGGVASGSTNIIVRYIIYSSTLSVVLADTAIVTVAGATGAGHLQAAVAVADSVTQQTVVITTDLIGTFLSPFSPVTTKHVTSAGVITSSGFTSTFVEVYSKPFYVGSTRYIFMLFRDGQTTANLYPSQPQILLFNMDALPVPGSTVTGVVVGKALVGSAAAVPHFGFLSQVIALSTSKRSIAAPYLSQTIIGGTGGGSFFSSAMITMDWNSKDAYQALVFNNQLLLNGAIPYMYDGNVSSELGFTTFPLVAAAFGTGNAGSVALGGKYLYTAIYQWTDNQGNLHQSGTPVAVAPTFTNPSPTSQTVEIDIAVPVFSVKDPAQISSITVFVYRTVSNGSTFYLVGEASVSTNPASTQAVTVIDNILDSTLVTNLPLYTNGNVLPNDPPPPSMILNSHNNRAWFLDSTNPNSAWYSKTSQETVGASFSGDLLVDVDSKGGPISGMSELDDKQILFKTDSRIVILYGDGANDTGTGSTLSQPQFVQTDVGCNASKSILSQPNGIIFKSPKGWYLMDRSTQMHYIGYPVENLNSQDVTSAVRMADKTLCVFLTSSGLTIAYDYFYNQWGTFTNHAGLSADIFQGLYTYVRTDGAVYKQNTSTYLDATSTYLLRLKTAWLRLNKIQSFQRVKQLITLGNQLSPLTGHGIQISTAYDFVETFSTPVQYLFPDADSVFQYQQALARQKCDTLSLLIEEVSAGAGQSGEYIDLTSLGFIAGLKKGQNKLPASRSVG